MRPNPNTRPALTGSPSMSAAHSSANAGTMNVTVLAAVGVVRASTRKKIGQATAVDMVPTAINDTSPSGAGVPGVP